MDIWVGGRSDAALKRAARLADGFFASFQTPEEFGTQHGEDSRLCRRLRPRQRAHRIGIDLLCRISSSRERALEEMRPMLTAMGRGAEAYLERTVYGSPDDVIARLQRVVARVSTSLYCGQSRNPMRGRSKSNWSAAKSPRTTQLPSKSSRRTNRICSSWLSQHLQDAEACAVANRRRASMPAPKMSSSIFATALSCSATTIKSPKCGRPIGPRISSSSCRSGSA